MGPNKLIIPTRREPSGKKQRPTAVALNQRNAETQAQIMATVKRQPHRRWAKDPEDARLGTPFGAFCVRNRIRAELHDAGWVYEGYARRLRAAKGVPMQAHPEPGGDGTGPGDALVREWETKVSECVGFMDAKSRGGRWAIDRMLLDGEPVGVEYVENAKDALTGLAVYLGKLDKKAMEGG